MGKVRHWKEKTAERTLCGRVPKDREVDMTLPICKTCDRVSEFYVHTYTMPVGLTSGNVNPDGSGISFVLTQASVVRLRGPKSRKRAS